MAGVKVMVFPGAHNLPLWLMSEIDLHYTKSRDEQIQAIQQGKVDVIHTSPDNLSLSDAKGLVAFLAGSVGPLHLVQAGNPEQPQILAVDNPQSGFGQLAYKWLGENLPNIQYDVVSVGGTPARYQALRAGQATMGVMHPPFTELCIEAGYNILGRIDEGYPTLCGAARLEFVESAKGQTYKDSYRDVIVRLSGSEGQSLARAAVAQNLSDIPREQAVHIADAMREAVVGAGVEFNLDAEGAW